MLFACASGRFSAVAAVGLLGASGVKQARVGHNAVGVYEQGGAGIGRTYPYYVTKNRVIVFN